MMDFIVPNWPAPKNVRAFTTLRSGGMSEAPYDSFNLADHVGDHEKFVTANRQLLREKLQLPNEPVWLEQTHSTCVLSAELTTGDNKADASFTNQANQVCAILTADCLPVLLCDRLGTQVAAIHAGWRGLLNGIIEKTLERMQVPSQDILVWLGPAIGPRVYELGEEVRQQFLEKEAEAEAAFVPSHRKGHWLGNLYDLARLRLQKHNVSAIYGGEYCTYSDKARFFSYRRDGDKTGRMASLIWIAS